MTSKAIRYINSSPEHPPPFSPSHATSSPTPTAIERGSQALQTSRLSCVTAQPKNGEANTAVYKLLAEVLGVAKTDVEIIKGHKSRYKTVLIPLYGTPDVNGYLGDVKRRLQGAVIA